MGVFLKTCKHCGTVNDVNRTECRVCGKPLPTYTAPLTRKQKAKPCGRHCRRNDHCLRKCCHGRP